mmetsp:Transcript_2108/g.4318  ORF Transcript_2108/g.4318 Transcript_2108/m.4318 type:complete len:229 (+) Transcript_2108:482-1168(+)
MRQSAGYMMTGGGHFAQTHAQCLPHPHLNSTACPICCAVREGWFGREEAPKSSSVQIGPALARAKAAALPVCDYWLGFRRARASLHQLIPLPFGQAEKKGGKSDFGLCFRVQLIAASHFRAPCRLSSLSLPSEPAPTPPFPTGGAPLHRAAHPHPPRTPSLSSSPPPPNEKERTGQLRTCAVVQTGPLVVGRAQLWSDLRHPSPLHCLLPLRFLLPFDAPAGERGIAG